MDSIKIFRIQALLIGAVLPLLIIFLIETNSDPWLIAAAIVAAIVFLAAPLAIFRRA